MNQEKINALSLVFQRLKIYPHYHDLNVIVSLGSV